MLAETLAPLCERGEREADVFRGDKAEPVGLVYSDLLATMFSLNFSDGAREEWAREVTADSDWGARFGPPLGEIICLPAVVGPAEEGTLNSPAPELSAMWSEASSRFARFTRFSDMRLSFWKVLYSSQKTLPPGLHERGLNLNV